MQLLDTGQLFDGHVLRGPARIEIDGDRIANVIELDAPAGDGDIACAFAMPGLIDSHVHIAGYTEGAPNGHPFEPMKAFLRLCGLAGVTTVRDLGNTLETLAYVREWAERFDGPRVHGAGPLLDAPPLTWAFSRLARTPAEARREVERLAIEGVDWIKAYRGVRPDVLETIVDTARTHDLPVAIDCGATSAPQAARAGVRSIEHAANLRPREDGEEIANPLDEARAWRRTDPEGKAYAELLDALREHAAYVCPTLLVSRRRCLIDEVVNAPFVDYAVAVMPYHRHFKRMRTTMGMRMGRPYVRQYMGIPELAREERQAVDEGLDRMAALVGRLHADGIPLAAGTDAPNPSLAPGFSLHEELAALVAAGLPTTAALESATGTAGALLGDPDLGVVRPGAHADLLCLDGDPVSDIGALGEIQEVVLRGRELDREEIRRKVQTAIDAVEAMA
jgi:imidazolonepropionase-like amidohydrolase